MAHQHKAVLSFFLSRLTFQTKSADFFSEKFSIRHDVAFTISSILLSSSELSFTSRPLLVLLLIRSLVASSSATVGGRTASVEAVSAVLVYVVATVATVVVADVDVDGVALVVVATAMFLSAASSILLFDSLGRMTMALLLMLTVLLLSMAMLLLTMATHLMEFVPLLDLWTETIKPYLPSQLLR